MFRDERSGWNLLPQRETLFEQLARRIERLIEEGRWKRGEMLPSEVELAEDFHVAQGTVRRALRILAEKGLLVRRQGRGTFVADYRATAASVQNRYVLLVPDGDIPSLPIRTELVLFEDIPAPAEAARALQIPAGSPVVHVKRVHFIARAGGKPVSFDEHFLPRTLFGALTVERMAKHEEAVLYAFYQNVCGVTISSCTEEVKAELLDEDVCRRYGLEPPFPVLVGRRIAATFGGKPVEWRIQRYTTADYHFSISF